MCQILAQISTPVVFGPTYRFQDMGVQTWPLISGAPHVRYISVAVTASVREIYTVNQKKTVPT